jgi:flagellar biosynthesis GTPase FlhF
MNVKKFVANSSREAWQQVRRSLGPDAIILSNRTTKEGVEILAMADEDISSLIGKRTCLQIGDAICCCDQTTIPARVGNTVNGAHDSACGSSRTGNTSTRGGCT